MSSSSNEYCWSSGKTKYPDEETALEATREYLKRPSPYKKPDQLWVYPCPDCHCWHMTSTVRKTSKRLAKRRH